jgi:hypothetical protein
MRMTITFEAPDDAVFATDGADALVRHPIDIRVGATTHHGMIVAAKVASDRRSFDLTVEMPDDAGLRSGPR